MDTSIPFLGRRQATRKPWKPWPLQIFCWLPAFFILVLMAVGLEVALHFSNKNNGWPMKVKSNFEFEALQYAYRTPAIIISMVVVGFWVSTAREIKTLQPYLDLSRGNARASRTILLDYAPASKFTVWMKAIKHTHFVVAIAALLSLLVLAFNPAVTNLFIFGDALIPQPALSVANNQTLGLFETNPLLQDFTVFMTAAGFSGAAAQYSLSDPPFVYGQWSLAPFNLTFESGINGTLTAQTVAVKSSPNCGQSASLNTSPLPDNRGLTNSATASPCNSSWDVEHNTTFEFEAFLATCDTDAVVPVEFRQVVFWFYASVPSPLVSAIFCKPSIELWNVTAVFNLATHPPLITSITPLQQITTVASITGPPQNGRAYNGIEFDDLSQDYFSLQRQNATRVQLPAAVLQIAETNNNFTKDHLTDLTNVVYGTYLKVLAKSVYFVPDNSTMLVHVSLYQKRVWLSVVASHVLAVVLLILAITSTALHLWHRRARAKLHSWPQPGSIAAAMQLGVGTELARLMLLHGSDQAALNDIYNTRRFGIDQKTLKITMDNESGVLKPPVDDV